MINFIKKNKQKTNKKQTKKTNQKKKTIQKNKQKTNKKQKKKTTQANKPKKTINTYKGNRKLSSNLCFPRSIPG